MKCRLFIASILSGGILLSGVLSTAAKKSAKPGKSGKRGVEVGVELTETCKKLEAKYLAIQRALKGEIEVALPKRDNTKIAAWLEAIKAEDGTAKDAAGKNVLRFHGPARVTVGEFTLMPVN